MVCTSVLVPYDDFFTEKVPVLVEFHKKIFPRKLITRDRKYSR